MDSVKRSNSLLKAIPSFGSKKSDTSQLSSKDKRYIQQVEKVLASFDSLEEWADYIAFLSRLQKSLQLSDDPKLSHTVSWIPYSTQVANKLSLCLSSRLPNGVHQKALSIYDSIFNALTHTTFNDELTIWLPGLLPILSFCSIQVKPQLIKIYKNHLLTHIYPENLKIVSKPLILSLLSGLDDENSEVFADVLDLMDTLKRKVNGDSHFWQSLFLCIISNPEKRLGALCWCNKRLPVFTPIKSNGELKFSEEAQACLTPESGLLVRMFATSINSTTTFNSASDIIIIRGFFDLLLTHLPLDSAVLNEFISPKDKELLVMACCKVTLKKDMSLNRRLWTWFLGPDTESLASDTKNNLSRSRFFKEFGLSTLSSGLLKMINSPSVRHKIEAFKISLSIIMDKWEISHLVIPRLFSPILNTCFANKNEAELLVSAQAFFDGVEASYIWNDLISLILDSSQEKLELLYFILKTFDFNEDEMITIHIPVAILALLINPIVGIRWLNILELLISLVPQRAFSPIKEEQESSTYSNDTLIDSIRSYYSSLVQDEDVEFPFPGNVLSFSILDKLKQLFINHICNPDCSYQLCSIFCEILYTIPNEINKIRSDKDLISSMLEQPVSTKESTEEEKQSNLLIAFSIAKIFNFISKTLSALEKSKLLKIILTNLWTSFISSYPANHQVEAVKLIFDLEISCPTHHIEAGVLNLLLKSSRPERIRAFSILWIHSTSFNEGDSILVRPLQLLLDDLYDEDGQSSLGVIDFIGNVLKNGSVNRLLKFITSPLLSFEFMYIEKDELYLDDDLGQFSYYLTTVLNVINANTKLLRDSFNNELAVMDSSAKLNLIKSNDWDISTYKSLIFYVIEKFFSLRLCAEIVEDENALNHYYNCVNSALELLSVLTTGSEPDFVQKFHMLINTCSRYINLSIKKPYEIELIQTKFVKCILHFLKISEDLKINLNLLHIDDEAKDPLLVSFIIQGIDKSQTSILLESWLSLLTRSLYLFNESVFSVLLTLNDAIINRIDINFQGVSKYNKFDDLIDVESSINILISGLEELLSISHSYLLTSNLRAHNDKNNNTLDSGFFGNVIQGVFSIESPAIRTSEQNKRYSILLSFQDAVKICFHIWKWADSKPRVLDNSKVVAERSLTSLAHKLKFRARKLLESLIDLERLEVIETLIDIDKESKTSLKLLNVLDGGRSQITLPQIFNSITTRCYPQILEDSQKSSLNIPISAKELSIFLVSYVESIDNDTVSDIWDIVFQFFKDVLGHSHHFKEILSDFLKVIKTLSVKINSSKLREQKKNKKELSDIFLKLLSIAVNNKSNGFAISESNEEESVDEDLIRPETPTSSQDEILEALSIVLEHLDVIIQDTDKVSNSINLIIVNLVSPQIKSKKIYDVPIQTLTLIDLIGKHYPNRSWKSLVFDSFMDNSFFNISSKKLCIWSSIIGTWIALEKEKIAEFISKVTPSVSTSPSNIFIWNESSEVENKIFTLKRISYLIMIKQKDYFLNNLDEIFNRIEYSLNTSCPASYRSEISTLLRVLTLKFSELHLLPRWTIISQELITIFDLIIGKNIKDLNSLTEDELKLILSGCKLLDQLLLLRYDEFNLNEWLFVYSNPDVVSGGAKDLLLSAIDRISNENILTSIKDSPIKIEQPHGNLAPLLRGVTNINSITSLRLFFDSLSLINYERTYGLYDIDFKACEDDLFSDIIS